MTTAAHTLLATLTESQRGQMAYPFDADVRTAWHYVPSKDRKGLSLKAMEPEQLHLVNILLNESLGRAGVTKTVGIMYLESVLRGIEVERDREGAYEYRDPARYFVTVFGTPHPQESWGWSFEGHHISLNFSLVEGRLVASTPAFFGANPHVVPDGVSRGLRILGSEEDRARRLMNSLDDIQREKTVIADVVPRDIFSAARPRVTREKPQGIRSGELHPEQLDLLVQLIDAYIENVADEAAAERRAQLAAGIDDMYFAWIGSVEPGAAHYYRVQAPSFLIEYDNIQNDANHSHTVWRDYDGDFGRDVIGEHRQAHVH